MTINTFKAVFRAHRYILLYCAFRGEAALIRKEGGMVMNILSSWHESVCWYLVPTRGFNVSTGFVESLINVDGIYILGSQGLIWIGVKG